MNPVIPGVWDNSCIAQSVPWKPYIAIVQSLVDTCGCRSWGGRPWRDTGDRLPQKLVRHWFLLACKMGILGSVLSCCGLSSRKPYRTYYCLLYRSVPVLWWLATLVVGLGAFGGSDYVHWVDVIPMVVLDSHT